MVNINKLVPRLSIKAKLAIAFALLTMVPLIVVSTLATFGAVRELRAAAERNVTYDVEAAQLRAAGAIREAEQHLGYVVEAVIRPLFASGFVGDASDDSRLVTTFLSADSSAVFRVKAVDADGQVRFAAHSGGEAPVAGESDPGGLYYYYLADGVPGETVVMRPVELLAGGRDVHSFATIPAVALVQPVRDGSGELLGVAVAEARADRLFEGLDGASPGLEGTTGLVNPEGLFLYHSERKRTWASLLASRRQISLWTELPPVITELILTRPSGTIRTADAIVSFRRIRPAESEEAPVVLYRTVPLASVGSQVRSFLLLTGGIGSGIVLFVLVMAIVAARQFTRPIYELRRRARALAAGGTPEPLAIETNDELEDLARDFGTMAGALVAHRTELESMVAQRTWALEMARAELEAVVSNAADAIIGLDADGHVKLWNKGAQSLFGYTPAEAVDAELDRLIGRGDAQEVAYVESLLAREGAVVNLRTERTDRDGEAIPVTLTESVIRGEDGGRLGAAVVIRDNRLQAKLDEQMIRSERLGAVSIMAAGLAHEINNPLGIIANRIELMQREARETKHDSRLERDLDVLASHVERLRGLTTDLLGFAREGTDDERAIDLGELSVRILRLLDRTFARQGIATRTAVGEGVEIRGNEKAIETLVMNLLLNAAQATGSGGSVQLEVERRNGRGTVEIRVGDTGPGVPAEIRDRIFEPFFTTKLGRGGTGLGLAVCRTVVERHRGEIRVENAESGGARFVVELPAIA